MISVAEARRLVGEALPACKFQSVDIAALRRAVLAESVVADREFPPFDRVAMDGIAIRISNQARSSRTFRVQSIQAAGMPPLQLADEGCCIEVMTGAVLPIGCDAVIRYEDCVIERSAKATATIAAEVDLGKWMNIHRRGSDRQPDDILMRAGTKLNAPQWGVLASVGKNRIKTFAMPKIAVMSTGDELVPVGATPESHQIRASNAYAIQAALHQFGIEHLTYIHASDDEKILRNTIQELLLSHDMLITIGAVSKGKFDYLPAVFADLRIRKIFHEVRQRPGKPLWFGQAESGQLVFGLPGNPVSVLVGVHAHVLPCLRKWIGDQKSEAEEFRARLSKDILFDKPMTLFQPVRFRMDDDAVMWADPVAHNGSGDFAGLLDTDGFVELPAENSLHKSGSVVRGFRWDQP